MATYVLVHGAWGGGWKYARVAQKLRASAAIVVFTPTLTGAGERSHLLVRQHQSHHPYHRHPQRDPLRGSVGRGARRPFLWRHGDHRGRRPHAGKASRRSSISTRSCRKTGNRCSTSTSRRTCRCIIGERRRRLGGLRVPPPPAAAFFGVNEKDAAARRRTRSAASDRLP